MKGEPEDRMLG